MDINEIKRDMEELCDDFKLIRNDQDLGLIKGFFHDQDGIQIAPGYDVQEEDWLLHIANGRKYYVKHLSPISIENQNAGWQIKYLTEKQHKNGQDQKPSISIGTIYGGAIVGNQSSATINNGYNLDKIKELISSKPEEDQEKLNELIDLVKSLTENNVPVSKGTFGKFSDLLSKHSDIAIFLSQSIMNWLSGK